MTFKKLAIYCATKNDILNAYDKSYKDSEELYHHFYPNRGTQPSYVRKKVLGEIRKDFKKEFLRDDLIEVNDYRFDGKILKNEDDMEKELKKTDVSKKSNLLKIFRCYYHPDDVNREKKKSKEQILRQFVPYMEIDVKVKKKQKKPRPSPSESATLFQVGQTKKGNDGRMYQVKKTKTGVKRWVLRK